MENRTQEIATTIHRQLKAQDYLFLARMGANSYHFGSKSRFDENTYLAFKASGSKVQRGGQVLISYDEAQDLYNVYIFRVRSAKVTIIGEAKGIFCDQLTEYIESVIG